MPFSESIDTMRGPIEVALDYFIPFKPHPDNGVSYFAVVVAFTRWLIWGSFIFTFILYIVAAVYPAWPLFERNALYWSMHLVAYPWVQTTLAYDASTHANVFVMQNIAMITMLLLIHPFVMMCVEAYLCNQLNDAEKLSVATCAAAYTDNYIDANSQLACANLVNVDITSIAHGSCAYLINHVASAVQAFEFIALIVLTYKDALLYFAMARLMHRFPKKPARA